MTAVEWQFEQLFNSFEKFNNGEYSFNEYLKRNLEIREQAKEIEKEQKRYSEVEVIETIRLARETELKTGGFDPRPFTGYKYSKEEIINQLKSE